MGPEASGAGRLPARATGTSRSRWRAARQVLAGARALAREELVVGTVGNVSVRAGDRLLITPTRSRYAALRARGLATVDVASGTRLAGGIPSRELPLHLAVLRARPDVGAVVHTHSRWATAWSFLGVDLGADLEEMAYYGIAPVRTSVPAPAGSPLLGARALDALGDRAAALIGRHGVLTVGASVAEALDVARVVEAQAHAAWLWRLDRRAGTPFADEPTTARPDTSASPRAARVAEETRA